MPELQPLRILASEHLSFSSTPDVGLRGVVRVLVGFHFLPGMKQPQHHLHDHRDDQCSRDDG